MAQAQEGTTTSKYPTSVVKHDIAGGLIVIETFGDGTVAVNGSPVTPAGSYSIDVTTSPESGLDGLNQTTTK